MAAVLAVGHGAALSHLGAAAHWQIWRRRVQGIDVLAPAHRRPRAGFELHCARRLDPRDVTVLHGIPVTTVARTLVDLTDVLDAHELANVIHEAAFRDRFSAAATSAAMARASGRRLRVLTEALAAHESGSAGTRSNNEDRFLALLRANCLPQPRVNVRIHGIEVDFHWPDLRLCVEVDGSGHARPRTRREDRARDQRLGAAGYRTLRFTEEDLRLGTALTALTVALGVR